MTLDAVDSTKGLNKLRNGYYYNPDGQAIKAGVTNRKWFKDINEAIAYANEQNQYVDQWRKDRKDVKALSDNSKIEDLLRAYLLSTGFSSLAASTKEQYRKMLGQWLDKRMGGVLFRNVKTKALTVPMVQRFYEERAKDNVYGANECVKLYVMLFNFGIRLGYLTFNPFSYVRKHKVKKRKEMWDRHYVRAFLNTAFSQWKWRNVGVLFYCLYEWGQRPSDIFKLKWDNIDWEKRSVTFTQSKRGAKVSLPISVGLYNLLKQQYNDFDLQDYIAPQMTRREMKWVPYNIYLFNAICKRIMEAAQIPTTLQVRDLRRTAITETVEGGADAIVLMQLSGHQSLQSLQPYLVHTLTGATKAQQIRGFPDQLMESKDDANTILNSKRTSWRRSRQAAHLAGLS
jgi:integrase